MANVLGIGGVFFKCNDRDTLTAWYEQHLGFNIGEYGGTEFRTNTLPDSAYCVWGPFRGDTEYFAPSTKDFMINFMVDDLDGVLARAEAGGATLVGEVEEYDYGRFGWFLDPEGNKIELWQPA